MGKKIVNCLGVGVMLFVFFMGVSAAVWAQEEMCVLPTGSEQVTYAASWGSGVVKVFTSNDQVTRGQYVEVWVESDGLGCPPYHLQVAGTGFRFGSVSGPTIATIGGDGEEVQLWASSSACGAATIVVTDGCNQPSTAYVRCTSAGQWVMKGRYCGLAGKVSCYSYNSYYGVASYELVQGNKKQYQATKLYEATQIRPAQGDCQWCEDWYAGNQCGVKPDTVDWENCIDGDHVIPGLTFCCSTNDWGCPQDQCHSSRWNCDEGHNYWLAHGAAACIWDRAGYGVQLMYYEWECQ